MVSISHDKSINELRKELKLIFEKLSAFSNLFETLKKLSKLEVEANVLRLSLPSRDNASKDLCVQIEAQSQTDDLKSYYLMVERKNQSQEYVRVVDGDRVDTLEDSHRTIYAVHLQKGGDIKSIKGVKKIDTSKSAVRLDLLRLLGLEVQQSIDMDTLTMP